MDKSNIKEGYSSSRNNGQQYIHGFYLCFIYLLFDQCYLGVFQSYHFFASVDHVRIYVWHDRFSGATAYKSRYYQSVGGGLTYGSSPLVDAQYVRS